MEFTLSGIRCFVIRVIEAEPPDEQSLCRQFHQPAAHALLELENTGIAFRVHAAEIVAAEPELTKVANDL
jgi:hypothetical protein